MTRTSKRNAVLLCAEPGCTVVDAAENLGINKDLLYRWRREYHRANGQYVFPGNGLEALTPNQKRIRELEKKLRDTEDEEDVPETIVVSRDVSKAKTRSEVESQPGDIPETVVISPQDSKARPSDSRETEASLGGGPEQGKRTALKASKDPAVKEKRIKVEDEDEDLPKTAILDPSKTRKEP